MQLKPREDSVFVSGTYGKDDYLLIRSSDTVCIAIKPVLENIIHNDHPAVMIGLRVRAIPSSGATILNMGHTVKNMFPNFTFQKTNTPGMPPYASSFIGSITAPYPEGLPWKEFVESLNKSAFISGAVNMLAPLWKEDETPMYDKDELEEFIMNTYKYIFTVSKEVVAIKTAQILEFKQKNK